MLSSLSGSFAWELIETLQTVAKFVLQSEGLATLCPYAGCGIAQLVDGSMSRVLEFLYDIKIIS